jgi:hypothetical protein
MAFVWEDLAPEQGKQLSEQYGLTDQWTHTSYVPRFRVVDADKQAFLVFTTLEQNEGTPAFQHPPAKADFIVAGQKVDVTLYAESHEQQVLWFLSFAVPPALEDQKAEIDKLLKEAVRAHETHGSQASASAFRFVHKNEQGVVEDDNQQ